MKVRMKVALSGSHDGRRWPGIGGVVDLADGAGAHLCANGSAIPVVDDPVETAVAPVDVETAEPVDDTESAVAVEDVEQRPGLTTQSGPVKRGPGRPRKNQA